MKFPSSRNELNSDAMRYSVLSADRRRAGVLLAQACRTMAGTTMKAIDELQPYIPDLVKNAMLVAWREICADTGCHPLDIEHGKNKFLIFEPRHWAQSAGEIVAEQIKRFVKLTEKERAKKIGRFVMTGELED